MKNNEHITTIIGCTSLKPENIKIYSPSARQELMQQFMLDMYLYNQNNDCNYVVYTRDISKLIKG